MIEEPPLLCIKRPARRPTAAQIAAFQGIPTGFINDAMYGEGALASRIRPIGESRHIDCRAAGPALTASNSPGDILATQAALAYIRPGDVVVAAGDEYQGRASAGDRVMGMFRNNGAIAFVSDAPVRDYDGIVAVGLPVWCTGVTPASPFMNGPGKVGYPVQIAGQQVETGDMVIGDFDGVVVVPFDRIDEVIERLKRVSRLEAERDADVENGLKIPKSMERMLASDQVRFED